MPVVVLAAVVAPTSVVEWHAAASHALEWRRAARVLAVLIGTAPARGTAAIGTAPTGMAVTGAVAIIGVVAIGTAGGKIRTVDGVGGTATSGVIPGTTSCSLAVSAFRGGGAGAGALGQAGAGDTRTGTATVTTATVILTQVAMAPRITAMGMDTVPSISMEDTETAANPE